MVGRSIVAVRGQLGHVVACTGHRAGNEILLRSAIGQERTFPAAQPEGQEGYERLARTAISRVALDPV